MASCPTGPGLSPNQTLLGTYVLWVLHCLPALGLSPLGTETESSELKFSHRNISF